MMTKYPLFAAVIFNIPTIFQSTEIIARQYHQSKFDFIMLHIPPPFTLPTLFYYTLLFNMESYIMRLRFHLHICLFTYIRSPIIIITGRLISVLCIYIIYVILFIINRSTFQHKYILVHVYVIIRVVFLLFVEFQRFMINAFKTCAVSLCRYLP